MNFLSSEGLPPIFQEAVAYQHLTSGQMLFQHCDEALAVFIVETGRLRLARHNSEGRIVTFEVVRTGESLAESALFSEVYNFDAIAEVNSCVAVYPKQLLRQILRDRPDLAQEFIKRLIKKNQSLQVRLELQSLRSARERLLQYLCINLPLGETTLNFNHPFKNIADEIGISPEVLYRTLARLEKEGIIARAKQQITLCKRQVA